MSIGDSLFRLEASFQPTGDQPEAIRQLIEGLRRGERDQVLLGVTGSGKTFTMAQVIAALQRPTLVIAHNKTLAAQLFHEFRSFFPNNAVEYFVSYYDYYQPEAYVPRTDTYIEKEATINDEIDKLRHSATRSLLERRDVIIVASVSCIYGLGSPESYHEMLLMLERGQEMPREKILHRLVEIHYERTNADLERGKFRVRGDVIEIFPSYEDLAVRVELFGDSIESLSIIDPLRGVTLDQLERLPLYPNSHYVVPQDRLLSAVESIKKELSEHLPVLREQDKLLEAQRVEQRTRFDLEMIRETGFCHGIENYSRHLTGRRAGEPPPTLMDYLQDDALVFIDESHATIPQVRGMYHGDQSRKNTLVKYGFRLPSALDNRPLKFEEFMERVHQVLYVSATPGPYELERSAGAVIEQIIRPTGLTDPEIVIKPVRTQVDDLLEEIRKVVERRERTLVTTLTKRMAEDLTEYYRDLGIKVEYLHSDVDTLERVRILRDLRRGTFDVLVGVNLLREGLDLPEVSLVAILDADKEGFLRSTGSLIQTSGRAARNVRGRVVMYADTVTGSMRAAIDEMERRREIQLDFNRQHGITPETIVKDVADVLGSIYERDYLREPEIAEESANYQTLEDLQKEIARLGKQMNSAARKLDFERAAQLRDRVRYLKQQEIFS